MLSFPGNRINGRWQGNQAPRSADDGHRRPNGSNSGSFPRYFGGDGGPLMMPCGATATSAPSSMTPSGYVAYFLLQDRLTT